MKHTMCVQNMSGFIGIGRRIGGAVVSRGFKNGLA